ncbi:hypothetical protein Dda_1491 [Drechslerella dactyloides]|uniref:Uncharacterized protein n=1 Tax=Drechslerella dactyloides TaxID=74499 RepID=A0AAD6J1U4_DREDA|nr:hypothetical protein Dda_1491 [Drechslerella dactyloides]
MASQATAAAVPASAPAAQRIDPYTICTKNLPNDHPDKPWVCVHCKFRRDEVYDDSRMPRLADQDIYHALCAVLWDTTDEESWREVLLSHFVPRDGPDYKRAGKLVSTMLGRFYKTIYSNLLLGFGTGHGQQYYDSCTFPADSIIARANFKLQRGELESDDESATMIHSDNAEVVYVYDPVLDSYSANGNSVDDDELVDGQYYNWDLDQLDPEVDEPYSQVEEGYYDYHVEDGYNECDVHEEVDVEGVETPGKRGSEQVTPPAVPDRAITPLLFQSSPVLPIGSPVAPASPMRTISSRAAPSSSDPEGNSTATAPANAVVDMIQNMAPTLSRHGGEVRITRYGSATIKFPRFRDLD